MTMADNADNGNTAGGAHRARPTIPRAEITPDGRVVPEGTAEQEQMYAFAEDADNGLFLDDIAPDEDADETRTAWSVFDESERVTKARGMGRQQARTLADSTATRLAQESRRFREHMDAPSAEGFRGFVNKIGLHLSPGDDERKARRTEHGKRVSGIHSQAIKRSSKEIGAAPMDIMVGNDGQWRCPAIAIGSQKGGVGKTSTVVALAEHFSNAKERAAGDDMLPAVVVDLNPDYGTVVSRIPGMRSYRGMSKNSYQLGTDCVQYLDSPESWPDFDALDYVWPTKWDYLKAVTNPPNSEERKRMDGYRISAIYECLARRTSVFLMDNGTQLTSPQMVTSASLANSLVLIIEATTSESQLETQLNEWYRAVQVNRNAFAGLRERMVVAIVTNADTARQRKSGRKLHKVLGGKGVASVVVPYDRHLGDDGPIDLTKTSREYQSSIAQLASLLLGNLNKASSA